jgi:hypothetical protein
MSTPSSSRPFYTLLGVLDAPLHHGLVHLLKAHDLARNLKRPPGDFAVELAELNQAGLTGTHLRWLVYGRLVQHIPEQAPPGQDSRVRGPTGALVFRDHDCFVLTDAGLAVARAVADRFGDPCFLEIPHWDAPVRMLSFRGFLVKRFTSPAPVQELILTAFQEDQWPRHLDDPLPRDNPDADPRLRLRDAVTALNRHQHHKLLRFHSDGNGEGLWWEPIPAEADTAPPTNGCAGRKG